MAENEPCACGIYPFITNKKDLFYPACAWHDKAYSAGSFHEQHFTRREVDRMFLAQMLLIAGDCKGLQRKAYLYYRITRLLGWMWWENKYERDEERSIE